ncbi:PilZ domain-containing protein [bacterium]|nr:PilZ domain-containing protein [bacterium]
MNLQAEFNYSESGQTEHITAFCNNLSHTGIQFTTSKALQPAQVIDIYFKTEHAKFQPLKGTVEVIRCTPTEEKTFVVAGKIIEYK